MSCLVPIDVVAIVEISVVKLADAMTIRYVVHEVAIVELSLGQRVLSNAFHLAKNPIALVSLLEHISAAEISFFRCEMSYMLADIYDMIRSVFGCPDHLTLPMRLSSENLTLVD